MGERRMERAIFAGGCFWCMIQPFDTLPGIHTIMSGYTGGHVPSLQPMNKSNLKRLVIQKR